MNLVYELYGEVGEGIDVFDLAPLLLSIGEILQEGNKTLFPRGKELSVNIKPFREGSFIIDVALLHKDLLQAALDFVLNPSNDVENIKALLKALGIIGGEGIGLFQLVKFLKGKLPSLMELKDGKFILFNYERTQITIDESVHKLYTNPIIGKEINRVGQIIEKDNIREVESYIKGEEQKTKMVKEDAKYFKEYIPGNSIEKEQIVENESVIVLNPKRGSYEGESNAWSFRKGGSRDEVINATIKDADFLTKIKEGKIRPAHTDLLKVRILAKQKIVGTEVVSVTYDILKIEEYTKSPEQTKLFDEKRDQ